ncbi:hypothetical protein NQZ68_041554 [Dissostichus eleginoides]|nr:hypothetical protein NQZ68_041554 [Dissostichus eleginoides]
MSTKPMKLCHHYGQLVTSAKQITQRESLNGGDVGLAQPIVDYDVDCNPEGWTEIGAPPRCKKRRSKASLNTLRPLPSSLPPSTLSLVAKGITDGRRDCSPLLGPPDGIGSSGPSGTLLRDAGAKSAMKN